MVAHQRRRAAVNAEQRQEAALERIAVALERSGGHIAPEGQGRTPDERKAELLERIAEAIERTAGLVDPAEGEDAASSGNGTDDGEE